MLLNRFQKYLKSEKNYSENTLVAYVSDLQSFSSFLREYYEVDPLSEKEVDEVTHKMIRTWMGQLLEDGNSRRTVARKIASLNTWYRFLRKSEVLEKNPAARVKVPKFDKKLPSFLKEDDAIRLMEEVDYPNSFEGHRDKCILEILYGCGLRRTELMELEFRNIDFSGRTLKVLGKGRKERIVPFGEHVHDAMKQYVAASKHAGIEYSPIFFRRKDGKELYPKLVYNIVKNALGKVSSMSKKSPHVLRHTFATHLLNAGADLNAIKELLGHKSLAATQIYVHNSISKLKNIYQKAHPKA